MSIITRAMSALGFEKRADTFDSYWTDFYNMRTGSTTPESAQSVAACYAAVGAIAEAVGALPLHLYRRNGDDRTRAVDHPLYAVLHHAPNDHQSGVEFREWMTAGILLHGNSFAKIERGNDGQVRALLPLPAERVAILRKGDNIAGYDYTDRDGMKHRLLPSEVFHLRHRAGSDPLIGVSPIQAARAVLDLAIAEASHGQETFDNGAKLLGILTVPGRLSPDQRAKLKESWKQYRNGGTPVLEEGTTYQTVSMNLEDSEWVAARRFSVEEVARIFKIPPVLIGDLSHANYSNSTEMYRWFTTHTLKRHISAWEGAISRQLLTEAGRRIYYPEHNAEGMLRGDSTNRADFYTKGIAAGWLLPSEARRLENLPTIEGIDNGRA